MPRDGGEMWSYPSALSVWAASIIAAITAVSGPASAASGATACDGYVGTTIRPQTFDSAVKRFAQQTPKSEFETTAEYDARKTAATKGTETLIISERPQSKFVYDADTQLISIDLYNFHNLTFDTRRALYSNHSISGGGGLYVVMNQTDTLRGQYEGQNSFGARATIDKRRKTTELIFERATRGYGHIEMGENIFNKNGDNAVGTISMPAARAKTVISKLKLALVVEPKDPYFVTGEFHGDDATISSPLVYVYTFKMLVADFKCGLVTDGANVVLAAFPMN